jgi:LDH2 family malate/lactate/ureidoglycolate dehydrogenase
MWKKKAGGVSQALNETITQYDTERIDVDIEVVRKTAETYLLNSGFNLEEARMTVENLLEAELAGKQSHGIIRLPDLRALQASGDIVTGTEKLDPVRSGDDFLYFDAEYMSGSVALYRSLAHAFAFFDDNPARNILMVGIRNMSYASGYIGDFARLAAERGLAFISFFNSPPILIPFGSREPQWGTDPVTFAFPRRDADGGIPVIHDSASSVITWGEMMNRKREGRKLPKNVALDEAGNPTTDPQEGMRGGLLTMGEHKGSGLALMVELLAGALTGSRVGTVVDGGWGGTYLLFRPTVFREDAHAVEEESSRLLTHLSQSPPRNGFDRVYYPGEQSQFRRRQTLEAGFLSLPELLWQGIAENAGEPGAQ